MAKIVIKNPDDLYTVQGDLITENYQLGLIGWKNPNDLIKYDESFMKIDTKLKGIENDKYDKTGGKLESGRPTIFMNKLNVSEDKSVGVALSLDGKSVGFVGVTHLGDLALYNETSKKMLAMKDDGSVTFDAVNLQTQSKDVIKAINENKTSIDINKKNTDAVVNKLDNKKYDKTGGEIKKEDLTFRLHNVVKSKKGVGVELLRDGNAKGFVGEPSQQDGVGLYNEVSKNGLWLNNDGTLSVKASNLITADKDVIKAINENKTSIESNKTNVELALGGKQNKSDTWQINTKTINNGDDLNNYIESGHYVSSNYRAAIGNNPLSHGYICLTVVNGGGAIQTLNDGARFYTYQRGYSYDQKTWTPWVRILTDSDKNSLETGINSKFDKTGGKLESGRPTIFMNKLNVSEDKSVGVALSLDGKSVGFVGVTFWGDLALYNETSKKMLAMKDDGSVTFDAVNLQTQSKDVIKAINEVNKKAWTNSNNPISKSQNGYCKLANGMIMQWGSKDSQGDKYFPVAFTMSTPMVLANLVDYRYGRTTATIVTSVTNRGFKCDDTRDGSGAKINWIAIGY